LSSKSVARPDRVTPPSKAENPPPPPLWTNLADLPHGHPGDQTPYRPPPWAKGTLWPKNQSPSIGGGSGGGRGWLAQKAIANPIQIRSRQRPVIAREPLYGGRQHIQVRRVYEGKEKDLRPKSNRAKPCNSGRRSFFRAPLEIPSNHCGLPHRHSRLPWAGRVSLLLRAGATGP
jgi:hypothetical protein